MTTNEKRTRRRFRRLALGALVAVGTLAVPTAASADPADPIGSLDVVRPTPGGFFVGGWSIDADTAEPNAVHVYVDGVLNRGLPANQPRPDVAAVYPPYGPNHGFSADIPAARGQRNVCVYAISTVGAGGNPLLGCRWVQVGGSPFGALDRIDPRPGGVRAVGWVIDPDTEASISVHAYLDGRLVGGVAANGNRPDVGAAFPGYLPPHGYSIDVNVSPGWHELCLYGIDSVGPDDNSRIACRIFEITGNTIGSFDVVTETPGGVRLAGWVIDPDTAGPAEIHVYVDGVGTRIIADNPRPDIAARYPDYGPDHGFDFEVALPAGWREFCLYTINVAGPGMNEGSCSSSQ